MLSENTINLKPINLGNAQKIDEICSPSLRLALLRYEVIADYYTQEPNRILIKKKEEDKNKAFEQVLRFRIRIPNKSAYSWSLYSENRDWSDEKDNINGLIIRYAMWNRHKDMNRVKSSEKSGMLLDNWPDITTKNIYFESDYVSELKKLLIDFDKIIEKGISLDKRNPEERANPGWYDMEVMRLFDWGQVHTTWSQPMENKEIEGHVRIFENALEQLIAKPISEVHQIILDYNILPDIWRQIVQGSDRIVVETQEQ